MTLMTPAAISDAARLRPICSLTPVGTRVVTACGRTGTIWAMYDNCLLVEFDGTIPASQTDRTLFGRTLFGIDKVWYLRCPENIR
jgi:hypothetical protein